ncbi:membrane protein, partial [Pontibacter sp. HJ8]
MKNEILTHLNDPGHLERLYRTNKAPFKREFTSMYQELKGNALADFWNERLNYETDDINWGTTRELLFVLMTALTAGIIAKIPVLFRIEEEFFYPRNIGFIFLPLLTAYFAWKNNLQPRSIAVICGVMLVSLIYINLLPASTTSDTLILACIHLPL